MEQYLFDFKYDAETELWYWTKYQHKRKGISKEGFETKEDCINDAIINGFSNPQ